MHEESRGPEALLRSGPRLGQGRALANAGVGGVRHESVCVGWLSCRSRQKSAPAHESRPRSSREPIAVGRPRRAPLPPIARNMADGVTGHLPQRIRRSEECCSSSPIDVAMPPWVVHHTVLWRMRDQAVGMTLHGLPRCNKPTTKAALMSPSADDPQVASANATAAVPQNTTDWWGPTVAPSAAWKAEHPRIVVKNYIPDGRGEDEIDAASERSVRGYHPRPKSHGRADLLRPNSTCWLLAVIAVVLVIVKSLTNCQSIPPRAGSAPAGDGQAGH
jgi:hypothetical protein